MARGDWQRYFPDFDVPELIDFMVEEGVLMDVSRRGGVGPSFQLAGSRDKITVQHPLRSLRETDDDFGRFIVDAGGTSNDSDDLEEALLTLWQDPEEDGGSAWDEIEEIVNKYARKAGR